MAVLAVSSVVLAAEKVVWEGKDQEVEYKIINNTETLENRLEMCDTESKPCTYYTAKLKKGKEISISDSNVTFFYEEFRVLKKVALLYYVNGKPYFIIVSIKDNKLDVFKINDIYYYDFVEYRVYEDSVYILAEERTRAEGITLDGWIRLYKIPDGVNFKDTVRYGPGYFDVIWGKKEIGCDETFPKGFILGIAPVESKNWYYWWDQNPRTMNVFDVETGERIKSFTIPQNTKIEHVSQVFCGENGEYELSMRQSTWKTRILRGKEE